MSKIELSVIIVSYNVRDLLRDCLKSVFEALGNISSEIFIVDNASSDQSAEMVEKEFPEVKLTKNKKNLGFSKAVNITLRKSKGEFVLLLNPDTLIFKDSISEVLKFMRENLKVGIATCKVELPNGEVDRDCHRSFPTPWNAFSHFTGLVKLSPSSKIFGGYRKTYIDEDRVWEIDACAGAYMMLKREVIDKIGLLDEDFFFYGEDLDYCYRAKIAGFRIMYFPKVKIIHYKGASSGMKETSKEVTKATKRAKRRAIKASIEAMRIFYNKHYRERYPFFVSWLVNSGISILGTLRALKA